MFYETNNKEKFNEPDSNVIEEFNCSHFLICQLIFKSNQMQCDWYRSKQQSVTTLSAIIYEACIFYFISVKPEQPVLPVGYVQEILSTLLTYNTFLPGCFSR